MNEQVTKEQIRKRQKNLLKWIGIIGGCAILLSLIALILINQFLPKEDDAPKKEIYFYPISDENIFDNSQYLAKDLQIYYCENSDGTGRTAPITDDEAVGAEVLFAKLYLEYLINGDEQALRAVCTQNYLEKNPISDFTQQMLYDMHIYYENTEAQQDGTKRVTYRLEYKILRNNGTYRRDVGSDGAKPEWLVLSVSPDQTNIRIDDVIRR
ncbi:MAG: hypothetical protein IKC59_06990 [Clostridia bacterium]|nr:hypothetical protein [Clostridia bacterium]